ncbi:MAG TPA: FHA domain-containing protein [Pirellulaceae bacterium]
MALITLRIIDGTDRGRNLEGLQPPVTIGREEGNTIQLNDDRVSRFHIKIQEDREKLVLTDLESTNGTLVNGEEIQIRILRFGDLITVGRTVLIFGSREEIAGRLAAIRENFGETGTHREGRIPEELKHAVSLDFELGWSKDSELQSTMHTLEPPGVPEGLDAIQAAQLSEIIEYLHIRLRQLLATVAMDPSEESVTLEIRQWQNLLDVQARLSTYLRSIGDMDRGS